MRRSMAVLAILTSLLPAGTTTAAEAPSDPRKQTPWGLYLTAREAYDLKMRLGEEALFVDVREPVEIMFTGFTDVVDVNIPFWTVNPADWNAKKSVLAMEPNPDFVAQVQAALAARGLGRDAPVMVMCRSGGTRGAPSANALQTLGLTQVFVVVDGFEGSTSKADAEAPFRNVNGWKNSGLPWGYTLNREKIHLRRP